MKYNKLTDLGFSHKDKHGKPHHLFSCDCGTKSTRDFYAVKRGQTKSCGCMKKPRVTHGMTHSRMYKIWFNMKARCENKKHSAYLYYGGRGIGCDVWARFEDFYRDMKYGYEETLTLDRIDNNKGYSKENCRWVTVHENSIHRRNRLSVTYNGETKFVYDWAKELGINPETLTRRIYQRKWTLERAFTQKVQTKKSIKLI